MHRGRSMRSPFPGMDPYLERHWGDVHTHLVSNIAAALNDRLPDDLIARVVEQNRIEREEDFERLLRPDVRVFESELPPSISLLQTVGGGTAAVAEPIVLRAEVEPAKERYVVIFEAQ